MLFGPGIPPWKIVIVPRDSGVYGPGHATASFTLDVYGHVTEKMKRESAERMQAYIDSIKKSG